MPTIKQRKAVERIVENHGNVSKSMVEAGYTPATAKNPKNLTESDGFKELVDEYLSDDLLAKIHKEGLEAKREVYRQDKQDYEEVPDYSVRHKYLDTAYKIKGSYAPEKSINLNINRDLTEEEKEQFNDLLNLLDE